MQNARTECTYDAVQISKNTKKKRNKAKENLYEQSNHLYTHQNINTDIMETKNL